ncbi:hypothetical protein ACVPPR_09255 [Dellaglioa sp. L3N]
MSVKHAKPKSNKGISVKMMLAVIVILLIVGVILIIQTTDKNFVVSDTSSVSSNSSFEDSSSAISSESSSVPDDVEYKKTSVIGPYSVSTEELNSKQFYIGNGGPVYSFSLDNQSGDGTISWESNDGGAEVPNGSERVSYQEIEVKRIKVRLDTSTRLVKVNTVLVANSSDNLYYAFENRNGGFSIAVPMSGADEFDEASGN